MKTLIVYATKYGCTEKAAKFLAEQLLDEVTLLNLADNKKSDLSAYGQVILGGSIYVGKIQKTMTKFVNSNLPHLLEKRIGLFVCAGQPDVVLRQKELDEAFPAELNKLAIARDVFGHEFCVEKLGFLDKVIVRKVAGVTESVYNLSEDKIKTFAAALNQQPL